MLLKFFTRTVRKRAEYCHGSILIQHSQSKTAVLAGACPCKRKNEIGKISARGDDFLVLGGEVNKDAYKGPHPEQHVGTEPDALLRCEDQLRARIDARCPPENRHGTLRERLFGLGRKGGQKGLAAGGMSFLTGSTEEHSIFSTGPQHISSGVEYDCR